MKTAAYVVCRHCSTHFRPTARLTDFCCAGCEFVHQLILDEDLERFYELKTSSVAPVRSTVFEKRDYSWLIALVREAEKQSGSVASLALDLQGVSCIGCIWLIEKIFLRIPGSLGIEVNPGVGRIELRWCSGEVDFAAYARSLQNFGYLLSPAGKNPRLESSQLVWRIGVCSAFALNAMLFTLPGYLGMTASFTWAPMFHGLALVFGSLSFFVGGSYFINKAWHGLRNGVVHIDLPIALGLIAAWLGSIYAWWQGVADFVYFDFVSVFAFLMLVGRWTQQRAVEKNRNRLLGLQTFVRDEDRQLTADQIYRVENGQVIPVRSRLLSARATLGMEWINGESDSRSLGMGQIVPSGAVNFSHGTIELAALENWGASRLAGLLATSPRSNHKDTKLERFLRVYLLVVVVIAVAGFLAWWLIIGDVNQALQVLISVLVVSCPCAAGVALPMVDELAVTSLQRIGVFVREQNLWFRLLKVKKIVFDKTGTLTLETLSLRNPGALDALEESAREMLLHLVSENEHPASSCLRQQLLLAKVRREVSDVEVEEVAGFGVLARTSEGCWRLGRPGWQEDRSEGDAECHFLLNNRVLARFYFAEMVRNDACEEVEKLRQAGYEVHILSGDRDQKVAAMARQLGLPAECCRGEMSPEEKAERIRALDCRDTLMIGDGANDSLAFNESFCCGTPAVNRGVLEPKSDFYFLGSGLNGVRELLEMAWKRRLTVTLVVGFALLYNLLTIVASLVGLMNPLVAAILMPLSSLASLGIVFARFATR